MFFSYPLLPGRTFSDFRRQTRGERTRCSFRIPSSPVGRSVIFGDKRVASILGVLFASRPTPPSTPQSDFLGQTIRYSIFLIFFICYLPCCPLLGTSYHCSQDRVLDSCTFCFGVDEGNRIFVIRNLGIKRYTQSPTCNFTVSSDLIPRVSSSSYGGKRRRPWERGCVSSGNKSLEIARRF